MLYLINHGTTLQKMCIRYVCVMPACVCAYVPNNGEGAEAGEKLGGPGSAGVQI